MNPDRELLVNHPPPAQALHSIYRGRESPLLHNLDLNCYIVQFVNIKLS